MSYKNDGYITTISGLRYYFERPTTAMIEFNDIATGLGNICRFVGQIRPGRFYSVAEHSYWVSVLVQRLGGNAMAALFHDGFEAYGGDVSSPLKDLLGDSYKAMEAIGLRAIMDKFNITLRPGEWGLIRRVDRSLLNLEGSLLAPWAAHWAEDLVLSDVHGVRPQFLLPERASQLFTQRYLELEEARGKA